MKDILELTVKLARENALIKYREEYKDKSDEELTTIFNNCKRFILATPPNCTPGQLSAQAEKAGEADACKEIYENRKKEREKEREKVKQEEEKRKKEEERKNRTILEAKKWWESKYALRKVMAIQRCPTTISYEGQLIAAIIDSEKEISEDNLFDIYQRILTTKREEFYKLLSALRNEGMICSYNIDGVDLYSLLANDKNLFNYHTRMSDEDINIINFMASKPESAYYVDEIVKEAACDPTSLDFLVVGRKLGRFKYGDLPNYFYFLALIGENLEDAK